MLHIAVELPKQMKIALRILRFCKCPATSCPSECSSPCSQESNQVSRAPYNSCLIVRQWSGPEQRRQQQVKKLSRIWSRCATVFSGCFIRNAAGFIWSKTDCSTDVAAPTELLEATRATRASAFNQLWANFGAGQMSGVYS